MSGGRAYPATVAWMVVKDLSAVALGFGAHVLDITWLWALAFVLVTDGIGATILLSYWAMTPDPAKQADEE